MRLTFLVGVDAADMPLEVLAALEALVTPRNLALVHARGLQVQNHAISHAIN